MCVCVCVFVGVVDEDTANAIEGTANAAQNQGEASTDFTVADRLKMAGMGICDNQPLVNTQQVSHSGILVHKTFKILLLWCV